MECEKPKHRVRYTYNSLIKVMKLRSRTKAIKKNL